MLIKPAPPPTLVMFPLRHPAADLAFVNVNSQQVTELGDF
jgi:hypothetical protein